MIRKIYDIIIFIFIFIEEKLIGFDFLIFVIILEFSMRNIMLWDILIFVRKEEKLDRN